MRKPSLLSVLLTSLVGLALAGILLIWMGATEEGGQVLGFQVGYQSPPQASGNWYNLLATEAKQRGLEAWQIEPWSKLEYTMAPRLCYYRARISGQEDGRTVRASVVLVAPDRGEWQVREWRTEE
jgi:hypothetical protein